MTSPRSSDLDSLRKKIESLKRLSRELVIREVNAAAKPTRIMKSEAFKLRKYQVRRLP